MNKTLSALLLDQAYEVINLKPTTNKSTATYEEGWSDAVLSLGNLCESFHDYAYVLKEEYQIALEKLLSEKAIFLKRNDHAVSVWVDISGVFHTETDHHEIQISEFSNLLAVVKQWSLEAGINAWVANKRNKLPLAKFQTSWFNSAYNRLRD